MFAKNRNRPVHIKKKIGGEKNDQRSLTINDKIVNAKIPKMIRRKL
tara:strand:- start:142 stop:279 length:138 start_codon:yes stop_codon:yes gene_type:complete